MKTNLKAADVLRAIAKRHPSDRWVFVPEVRVGTGYNYGLGPGRGRVNVEQRIDAWAAHCWPSQRHARYAYEIKVARADFLHELKKPMKRAAALRLSNRFYFAAPTGLIKKDELPAECGLVEVSEAGRARVAVEAIWRDCDDMEPGFVISILRKQGAGGTRRLIGFWTCWCGQRNFNTLVCVCTRVLSERDGRL